MLSVIIPTLNEARTLPVLIQALEREVGEADEILVSDGGSTDGTVELARALGARLVGGSGPGARAARGRGAQLAAGVAVSRGDRLWFLHADSVISSGSGRALAAASAPWGCFATRIGTDDPRLRLCARWMTRRARLTGSCTGDMGMWMDRAVFSALGGFRPLPAFEDLDLSDRARARYAWEVLEPALTTSSRRWEAHGTSRTMARLLFFRAGYRLGIDPTRLAAAYTASNRNPE